MTVVSTHACGHEKMTCTPLSCGGDECDTDSLSLLRQSYRQTYVLCVYVYVCYLCIYIYIYT